MLHVKMYLHSVNLHSCISKIESTPSCILPCIVSLYIYKLPESECIFRIFMKMSVVKSYLTKPENLFYE